MEGVTASSRWQSLANPGRGAETVFSATSLAEGEKQWRWKWEKEGKLKLSGKCCRSAQLSKPACVACRH